MEMARFYWIEHPNKTGKASSAKIHNSVTIKKRENVDRSRSIEDYGEFDDSALKAIQGLEIELYIDGELVE